MVAIKYHHCIAIDDVPIGSIKISLWLVKSLPFNVAMEHDLPGPYLPSQKCSFPQLC